MTTDPVAITHDQAAHRFTTQVDGLEAYVEYEPISAGLVITHTIVPDPIGGRGIASQLVHAAYDYARAQGLKVVPQCSYAAAWLRRHPDYADLSP